MALIGLNIMIECLGVNFAHAFFKALIFKGADTINPPPLNQHLEALYNKGEMHLITFNPTFLISDAVVQGSPCFICNHAQNPYKCH